MRVLFPQINPLKISLHDSFFRDLPCVPGVYKMYGADEQLLYVGKAKNLKMRLSSYCAQDLPVKVRRLIRFVQKIDFEILQSERAALLRENQLLRLYRPPYNRQKTHPESYFYLEVQSQGSFLKVQVKREVAQSDVMGELLGAFKGQSRCSSVLMAAYRVLSLLDPQKKNLERETFRTSLQRSRAAFPLVMEFSSTNLSVAAKREISRFLRGVSKNLIRQARFHEEAESHSMIGWFLKKDIETLEEFFSGQARRFFRMRQLSNRSLISQSELDDYIVRDTLRS